MSRWRIYFLSFKKNWKGFICLRFLLNSWNQFRISVFASMFLLRVFAFTLHYFMVELPFTDSFNFFSIRRNFFRKQQQQSHSPLKSQHINNDIEEKSCQEASEISKGESKINSRNDSAEIYFSSYCRKFQSKVVEWNRSSQDHKANNSFVREQQYQQHNINTEDCSSREFEVRSIDRFWSRRFDWQP